MIDALEDVSNMCIMTNK